MPPASPPIAPGGMRRWLASSRGGIQYAVVGARMARSMLARGLQHRGIGPGVSLLARGWELVGRALYMAAHVTSRCVLGLPYLGIVSSECCAEQGSI